MPNEERKTAQEWENEIGSTFDEKLMTKEQYMRQKRLQKIKGVGGKMVGFGSGLFKFVGQNTNLSGIANTGFGDMGMGKAVNGNGDSKKKRKNNGKSKKKK